MEAIKKLLNSRQQTSFVGFTAANVAQRESANVRKFDALLCRPQTLDYDSLDFDYCKVTRTTCIDRYLKADLMKRLIIFKRICKKALTD